MRYFSASTLTVRRQKVYLVFKSTVTISCNSLLLGTGQSVCVCVFAGMNSAVRAVVRMGLFVGCQVYLIREVSQFSCIIRSEHSVQVFLRNCKIVYLL